MRKSDVLILGAGPAGMAAAMELTKHGRHVTMVEKASQVGGLAKTLAFTEKDGVYLTDIGPHRFFSKNKYLYDFIEDLLGEEWGQIPRLTRFYVHGKFYFYPIRFGNALRQMGLIRAFRVILDYGYERIRELIAPRNVQNFEDYVVRNFGWSLARFNMLNYTEKIWGIPCKEISVDWAYQRIAGLSLFSTIKKMLFKNSGPKSLVDTFYYPSFGSGTIYEAIKKRIEEEGNPVHTLSEPVRISWKDKRVSGVEVRLQDGSTEVFFPKATINSVPLTQTVTLFDPPAPPEVLEAAKNLRFRSQVYLFLTINKDQVVKDNWVYFPDKEIPFGRISEMKNFSKEMCPEGKTSLFIEFFCFEGDEIWNMTTEELTDSATSWFEKFNFLKREEILSARSFKQRYAYPIYDIGYKERLNTILHWLDSFENFFAIGRPGRFRYTNQDHSLEMGILAAQSVLDGKRRNIDEVGTEQEYFEKGYAPMKSD